ncbi:MAG: hypothetical protein Q4G51_16960 [Dermatophilus congolensis]|nr:hypothetical protein [Dermatophilus congolensis]
MSNALEFIRGVDRLHAFYTENVRMLAHAYDLSDEEAARILDNFDYRNVSRSILRPPRISLIDEIPGIDGN